MEKISLEEIRKLEPALERIPDKELEKIRQQLYDLGQLALECFIERKVGSKMSSLVPQQTRDNMQQLEQCEMKIQTKE